VDAGPVIRRGKGPAGGGAVSLGIGQTTPSSQLTDRGAERLFVGKRLDDAVTMSDAADHQWLRLKVESSGAASIEFLDESGNVLRRIGPG
jgi:hypothetical protein